MDELELPKLDKTTLTVSSLFDNPGDKHYWLSKTPAERLAALEQMRRILYGYDPSTTRLQRILTVAQRQSG